MRPSVVISTTSTSSLILVIFALIGPRGNTGVYAGASTEHPESEPEVPALKFVREPPSLVDFSNSTGGRLDCVVVGEPKPTIGWTLADGRTVIASSDASSDVVRSLRRPMSNGSLYFPPFAAHDYRQDVHAAVYRCRAENSHGVVVSRDVRVRAVVLQLYEAQVYDEFVIKGNTAVLKCHIPTFVADYVTVTSWRQDDSTVHSKTIAGPSVSPPLASSSSPPPPPPPLSKYVVMPSGELHVGDVEVSDSYTSYRCVTRHRLTGQVRPSAAAGRLFVTYPMGSVPPRITDSKVSVTVSSGQTAILPCVAQGYPLPEVTWFVKGGGTDDVAMTPIRSGTGNHVIQTSGLRIREAASSATYVCVANNTVGTERVETSLHVTAPLSVRIVPSRQVADLGQSASFRCVTAGAPITSLSWLKNGKPLFTSEHRMSSSGGSGGSSSSLTQNQGRPPPPSPPARDVLRFERVEQSDRGLYQCIAGSDTDSAQAVAQLELGDVSPILHYTFPETILNPDARVSMRCVASGSPQPHFRWTLDGVDVLVDDDDRATITTSVDPANNHVTSALNMAAVRVEDGGLYGCVAVNKAGSVVHSSRLNVYGHPFVRSLPKISAVASHDVAITCPASGYPLASITWERGGRVLPTSHHQVVFPNGTLYLKSVQRMLDAGKYTCVVRNDRGQVAQRDFDLVILVPPHIIPFSFMDDYVLEGTLARVSCVVGRGDHPLTLAWTKDGQLLSDRGDDGVNVRAFDEQSTVLTVQSATSRHNGNYTCLAINPAGSSSHTARLVVNVPPRWVVVPDDVSVLTGDRIELHCRADGFPTPNIEWMKAVDKKPGEYKRPVDMNDEPRVRHLNNGSLIVTETRPSDAGQYLCRASNGVGAPLGLVVNVHVQVPVHFESKSRNQTARRLESVQLRCDAKGEPPIHVEWMVNGVPIKCDAASGYSCKSIPSGSSLLSEVHVARAERRNTASYVCAATNKYGRDEHTIHLTVVERPEAPRNLKASDKNSRTMTLSWSPPFDGNSAILKYVVQYKHAPASWHGKTINFTVSGIDTTTTVAYLQPADSYHVRVIAINALGASAASDVIAISTLEEAPGGPPLDIKTEVIGNGVVKVTWKSPKRDLWNGRILGYYVGYRPHDSSGPYTFETVELSGGGVSNNNHNLQDVVSVNLTRLKKFTRYGIIVQAYNQVGTSPRSEEHVIVTSEDVPSSGPEGIKCSPLSAQSLHVSWDVIPTEFTNGILQGYKIIYHPVEEWYGDKSAEVKITTGSKTVLSGLSKYTNYSVQLMGFTQVGDGVKSAPCFCLTNEDVPEAPADVKVAAISATSSLITWKEPARPNGVVVKYTVYKRTTSHIDKEAIEKSVIAANRLYYEANDLRKGERYEFWVTASTSLGEGQSTRVVVHSSTGSAVPAKVMSFDDKLDVAWKSELALPCKSVGLPEPHHDWTFRGKPLALSSRLSIESDWTLVIQGTQVSDSGVYSCRAYNVHGSDEITYTVTVQVPPSPPALVVSMATLRGLEVRWKRPDKDSGILVTGFYLHYKKDFGEWQRHFVTVDRTSFALKELDCGSRYHLYITAVNHIGEGNPSEVVTTRTEGLAPQMPRKHTFLRESSTFVTLQLDAWISSCAILYFVVHYRMRPASGDHGDWKLVSNNVLMQQKEFIIPDLLPATWYRVRVTAHNHAGSTVAEYDFATRTVTGDVLPEMIDDINFNGGQGIRGSDHGVDGGGVDGNGNNDGLPFYYSSATMAISVACIVVSLVFVVVICVACRRRTPRSSLEFNAEPPHADSRPRSSSETAKNISNSSSNYLLNNGHRLYSTKPGPLDTPTSDLSGDISPYATSQIPGCYAAHLHQHAQIQHRHPHQQQRMSSPHVYPPLRDLQEVQACDGTYPGARKHTIQRIQQCSLQDRHFVEGYTLPLNSVDDLRMSITRLPSEYDCGSVNSWSGRNPKSTVVAVEHIDVPDLLAHAVGLDRVVDRREPTSTDGDTDCSASASSSADVDQARIIGRYRNTRSPRSPISDMDDDGTDFKETSFTFVAETKIGAFCRIGDVEFSDTESERDILNRRKLTFSPLAKMLEVKVPTTTSTPTTMTTTVASNHHPASVVVSPWNH